MPAIVEKYSSETRAALCDTIAYRIGNLLQKGLSELMQKKPNFVVILTDDQGYQDIGCFGSPLIKTPNLDRMAGEGTRFTSFYTQPICGPSRAALMTGCYPLRVAERDNIKNVHPVLHSNEITMAELLKPHGYATAMIGKWDLAGHAPRVTDILQQDLLPHCRGFDMHFGTPASNDRWARTALLENGRVLEDPIDLTQSTTRRYADKAIAFMRKHKSEPFFVYLAPNMPHIELHAGRDFVGRSARGLYGDVIEELDHAVGMIINELHALDLARETYLIFASDNGPWLCKGSHGGSSDPLRSGKLSTWEGGPRVPCIMWAPGRIPEGKVCHEIATSMDILPTFAELAGVKTPDDRVIDGRSILHLLQGRYGEADPKKNYFYYIRSHLQAVRREQWKLILARPEDPVWLAPFSPNTHIAPWDDIGVEKPMLYDLGKDIAETRDVADTYPRVVGELLDLAEEARQDIGDYDRKGAGARFFDDAPPRPDIV